MNCASAFSSALLRAPVEAVGPVRDELAQVARSVPCAHGSPGAALGQRVRAQPLRAGRSSTASSTGDREGLDAHRRGLYGTILAAEADGLLLVPCAAARRSAPSRCRQSNWLDRRPDGARERRERERGGGVSDRAAAGDGGGGSWADADGRGQRGAEQCEDDDGGPSGASSHAP